jgi:guanylate kinase
VEGNKKGRLFVVAGPSGVGKSTIIERFMEEDRHIQFSVSYTTRDRRRDETQGKDYYFVDRQTFREMADKGYFLEWEEVHDHLYGTPRREVREHLEKGTDILLDIDVKGALRVKAVCPEACLIFFEPPSKEELVKRLTARGEKEIDLRMKRVEEELARKYLFQYVVINDKLDLAYEKFKSIVETVRRKGNGENNR